MPEPTGRVAEMISNCPPKLLELTNDVVFNDIWARPELSGRDRSLITIATLIANGTLAQLPAHTQLAMENGLTQVELDEVVLQTAIYAGWPRAISAAAAMRTFPINESQGEPEGMCGKP